MDERRPRNDIRRSLDGEMSATDLVLGRIDAFYRRLEREEEDFEERTLLYGRPSSARPTGEMIVPLGPDPGEKMILLTKELYRAAWEGPRVV